MSGHAKIRSNVQGGKQADELMRRGILHTAGRTSGVEGDFWKALLGENEGGQSWRLFLSQMGL